MDNKKPRNAAVAGLFVDAQADSSGFVPDQIRYPSFKLLWA